MTLLRAALLSLSLAAPAAAEAQALFKCVGRDGKVSYQSEKCADAVRESTVRPPDPVVPRVQPAPSEAATAGADAKAPAKGAPNEPVVEWNVFVAQLSGYENCAALVPGFGSKHQANFNRWRERHRTAYARFNQDGEAQRKVRESTQYVRANMNARTAEQRQYDIDNCENSVAAVFAPQTPATGTPPKN